MSHKQIVEAWWVIKPARHEVVGYNTASQLWRIARKQVLRDVREAMERAAVEIYAPRPDGQRHNIRVYDPMVLDMLMDELEGKE